MPEVRGTAHISTIRNASWRRIRKAAPPGPWSRPKARVEAPASLETARGSYLLRYQFFGDLRSGSHVRMVVRERQQRSRAHKFGEPALDPSTSRRTGLESPVHAPVAGLSFASAARNRSAHQPP